MAIERIPAQTDPDKPPLMTGLDTVEVPGCYRLSDLKRRGEVTELIAEGLYFVVNTEDEVVIHFGFFTWTSETAEDVYVTPMWLGQGIGGVLRELRYSWFGDTFDGFLFYASPTYFRAAADKLLEYFDEC